MSRSPWQRVLGAAMADLAPGLRAYFGAIPEGYVGRGQGVFEVVGTPKRWLWPAFALLARGGVVFPVWEHAVPFTVTNRPGEGGTVRALVERTDGNHQHVSLRLALPLVGTIYEYAGSFTYAVEKDNRD